jgi:hypothetical protein
MTEPVTTPKGLRVTSWAVAQRLGLKHYRVARAIKALSAQSRALGIESAQVASAKGWTRPGYLIGTSELGVLPLPKRCRPAQVELYLELRSRDPMFRRATPGWPDARAAAARATRTMQEVLDAARTRDGKERKPTAFINESRLLAKAAAEAGADAESRDDMALDDLLVVAELATRNTVAIAAGQPYDARKEGLIARARALKATRAAQA